MANEDDGDGLPLGDADGLPDPLGLDEGLDVADGEPLGDPLALPDGDGQG